jgi:hypothetical protein
VLLTATVTGWVTFGAQVSDGVITTFLAVFLTSMVALFTWLVREMYRLSSLVSKIEVRVESHDGRLMSHSGRLDRLENDKRKHD